MRVTPFFCAGQDWQGQPDSPVDHPRPPRITPPPPHVPCLPAEPSPTLPKASSSAFFCALPSQPEASSSGTFTLDPDCMPIPMSLSSPDLRCMPDTQHRPLSFSALSNSVSETLPQAPSLSQDLSAMPSTSMAASRESADFGLCPPVMQSLTPVLRQPSFSRRGRVSQLSPSAEGSFNGRQTMIRRFPDLSADSYEDAAQMLSAEPSRIAGYVAGIRICLT